MEEFTININIFRFLDTFMFCNFRTLAPTLHFYVHTQILYSVRREETQCISEKLD